MKTTIDLPAPLATEAKELAREQGTTLRDLVIEGLRSELRRRTDSAPDDAFVFPISASSGPWPDLTMEQMINLSYGFPIE